MHLPVFPLPVFLLPNGITRLRIFEPRYLKLVSIACQGQGFALCLFDHNEALNVPRLGVWVEIIDFYEEGELLYIDIKAKSVISLHNVTMDSEKLRFADCKIAPHWEAKTLQQHHIKLADQLKKIYAEYPEQGELYAQPDYQDPNWLCARFLEILPLSFEKKMLFIEPDSYEKADVFLQEFILGKKM